VSVATLEAVFEPVAPQLRQFERYVRGVVRTSVPLLNLVLWYLFRRKGKRVRPALVFLSAAACGGVSQRAFVGAALVELLHTATLVHDDVVDEASTRRGAASVNALWGNSVAVLVGDYLLARGLLLAIEQREYEFLQVTSQAVQQMSAAELRHIQLNRKVRLDEEAYLEVVRGKTAALFRACCQIGALSAGGDEELQQHLGRYGEYVGMAFQLRDDVLDYVGTGRVLGKPAWQDLREHKVTLPVLVALRQMSAAQRRAFLRQWKKAGSSRRAMAPLVQQILDRGGVEYSLQLAQYYGERALEELSVLPPSPARAALEEFARFAVERTW
jgi:octaprenyl-diphosphate synthase